MSARLSNRLAKLRERFVEFDHQPLNLDAQSVAGLIHELGELCDEARHLEAHEQALRCKLKVREAMRSNAQRQAPTPPTQSELGFWGHVLRACDLGGWLDHKTQSKRGNTK
ncbi:MAG: hypothetical protein AAFQ10_03305 [Pseudomonadota bacterium]